MSDFQTSVLDNIAKVIGGSQPDATNRPRFFSGDQVGDSTGLQAPFGPTFKGCYSAPVESPQDFPIGLLLLGPFTVKGPMHGDTYVTGVEENIDDLRLLILQPRVDSEVDYANLAPYRDLVPAALAAKISAFSVPNIVQVMCSGGKPVRTTWGQQELDGYEFTLRLIRLVPRQYAL